MTGDLFRAGEIGVPAQQVLGSADLQNLRGLVLDDPVRAMQILPGVAATDDLYAEFSVRGSDFGRIGLAVDGVPSRFLSHSVQGVEDGGSIGMINSDVLASVSLQNGSYPQRFGNRTGAQIEMTLRDGSRDRTQARIALGGSSASVVGEGPIGRGRKASWLFSARKSYLDLLIKQIADNETFAFGFTDVATKFVVDVSARHQLQLSALAGRAALDADQRDIGPNDPLVATNRALAGRADLALHAGPRVTWTQRVGVTGGAFSNRSLARVVLDEGRSTDISARSDAVIAVHPSLIVEAGGSAHWQDERVTKRRVRQPDAPARHPRRRRARFAVDGRICAGAVDAAAWGDGGRRCARRSLGRHRRDHRVAMAQRTGAAWGRLRCGGWHRGVPPVPRVQRDQRAAWHSRAAGRAGLARRRGRGTPDRRASARAGRVVPSRRAQRPAPARRRVATRGRAAAPAPG